MERSAIPGLKKLSGFSYSLLDAEFGPLGCASHGILAWILCCKLRYPLMLFIRLG